MKRLLIVFLLIGVIYILGIMTFDQIKIYLNKASLVMSGINQKEIKQTVVDHFNENILEENSAKIEIKKANVSIHLDYINDDTEKDMVAIVDSTQTCGSGGCLASIFIQDEIGKFNPINFNYAVKEIEIKPSITNGMHDISINGDSKNIMTWDGVNYVLNAF